MSQERSFPPYSMTTVLEGIAGATTAIASQLTPNGSRSAFRTAYHQVFRDMRNAFETQRPEAQWGTPGYVQPAITLDEDYRRGESTTQSRAGRNTSGRHPKPTPLAALRSDLPKVQPGLGKTIFHLDGLKRSFDDSPGGDLVGAVDTGVVQRLAVQPMGAWKDVASHVVGRVRAVFIDMLEGVLDNCQIQITSTDLSFKIQSSATALLDELLQPVARHLRLTIDAQRLRAVTYSSLFSEKKRVYEARNLEARRNHRVAEYLKEQEALGEVSPTAQELEMKAGDTAWVSSTLGADGYEREVQSLATCFAYYDVAATDTVDAFAREIERGLVAAFGEGILHRLVGDLYRTDNKRSKGCWS